MSTAFRTSLAAILIAIALPAAALADAKSDREEANRTAGLASCLRACTAVRTSDQAACGKIKDDIEKSRCVKRARDDEDQCDNQCERKFRKR